MKRLKKKATTDNKNQYSPLAERVKNRMHRILMPVSSAATALLLTTSSVFATNKTGVTGLFSKIGEILNKFYLEFVGITTITTVLIIVVTLLSMQAADDDDTRRYKKRIKRCVLSWVVIMILGSIIAVGEDLFSGMQYTYKQ